jgi:hypothetical protein
MQATGMVNDHLITCPSHLKCKELAHINIWSLFIKHLTCKLLTLAANNVGMIRKWSTKLAIVIYTGFIIFMS